MTDSLYLLMLLPAAVLVSAIFVPNVWANLHVRGFKRLVIWVVGLQFLIASCLLVAFAAGWIEAIHVVAFEPINSWPVSVTLYYDGVSSLMFTLVSFVSWVICRYSSHYLAGESTQGRYFRWNAFTIGAVSMMVLSGNLLMFIAAWILTSLGLHQLLLHYGHRRAAQRAAWTKYTISRIGDTAIIAAMVILYFEFKTLDFVELFAAVDALTTVPSGLNLAGFLLIAGAATKSAQFPFHTWLPHTMETPTPVSALMHAGIVNAGGYLIIRTSPLVAATPWALTALAIIGGFTACFGSIVMLTQTSIKKSLAYSTIAQMGFMLLQCGLGAYSAAMLHILAHSLYKAYAFLSSGSVLVDPPVPTRTAAANSPFFVIKLAAVGGVMIAMLSIACTTFGIDPVHKGGGVLLGGILCLAFTYWIGQVIRTGNNRLVVRATLVGSGLCFVYAFSYFLVDNMVSASLPTSSGPQLSWLLSAVVITGFIGLFSLQSGLASGHASATLHRWHIHAANGFYLENMLRRVFEPLFSR